MKTTMRSLLWALPVALLGCSDASAPTPDPDPDAVPTPQPTPEPTPQPRVATPPPISGGTLAVLADGKTAVASDPDRDQIYVVDLSSRALKHTIVLNPGDEPGRHVQDGNGTVHVSLRGGNALLSFDAATGKVLARRSLCTSPRGVAFDAARNLLHLACADGQLVSIEPNAAAPARTVELERDLRDVLVRGNELFVTTFRQANVITVDASTGREVKRTLPNKTNAAFGGFRMISGERTASPSVAWRMVAAPDGNPVVIHQRGLDGEVTTAPGGYGDGQSCAGIVEAAITKIDATTPGALAPRSTKALSNAVLPVDLAVSPDGRQLAFVAAGNARNQVQFVAMEATAGPSSDAPPQGMFEAPGGSGGCEVALPAPLPAEPAEPGSLPADMLPEPVEYRPPNGEVIAVAFDPKGNVLVQSRNPSNIQILTQRADAIALSTEGRWDMGHQVFHAATSGQMACASCHPEGGEDSRAWKFQRIGIRRTQSLRGGIMETAPFHWDGDLRDMSHLMTDVFQGRMGGQPAKETQIEALAGWIDSIPNLKVSVKDPQAVERGRALFSSSTVGCTTCHSGEKLTNNTIADVGTGRPLQTPQLMGLALRAPYMHDGCAKTLKDRFTSCGGDNRHGLTSTLTEAQINDLVSYLETL